MRADPLAFSDRNWARRCDVDMVVLLEGEDFVGR
jgi:hypothetical protein